MTPRPKWISKKVLLSLHEESLASFGGARGLRDDGLLDFSLARPLNARGYKPDSTITEQAASYAFGFSKNPGRR